LLELLLPGLCLTDFPVLVGPCIAVGPGFLACFAYPGWGSSDGVSSPWKYASIAWFR
jgi:hypothetical protein